MKIVLNPATQEASLVPDTVDVDGFAGCTLIDAPVGFTWVGKSVDWDAMEVVDLPPPVPAQVTPLQIRKAIRAAGLSAQVEAFKATCSDEVLEAWEFASSIDFNDPMIVSAAAALEMTDEQKADLFRLASTL